jgi:hypothetical protein
MENETMKLINDKVNAFQAELAKEFGVVLQAGINLVPVNNKIADAVDKIADAVSPEATETEETEEKETEEKA